MGSRLIILLALLVGVLYSIHLLVKDYQAITAPRLLRMLFKRDLESSHVRKKPYVRWKKILHFDSIQCARLLYCSLGYDDNHTEVQSGFIYMLTLQPNEEEASSMEAFKDAYMKGVKGRSLKDACRQNYPSCPFNAKTLFELIQLLLSHKMF